MESEDPGLDQSVQKPDKILEEVSMSEDHFKVTIGQIRPSASHCTPMRFFAQVFCKSGHILIFHYLTYNIRECYRLNQFVEELQLIPNISIWLVGVLQFGNHSDHTSEPPGDTSFGRGGPESTSNSKKDTHVFVMIQVILHLSPLPAMQIAITKGPLKYFQ